ncbi:RNApolymerase sigma-subunit F [Wolffia australiana]
MEAGRSLVPPTPAASTSHVSRGRFKKSSFSPSPVLIINGQASRPIPAAPIMSVVRHFHSSVALQEQQHDFSPYIARDETTAQVVALDSRPSGKKTLLCKGGEKGLDEYLEYFERLLPSVGFALPCSNEGKPFSSEFINSDRANSGANFDSRENTASDDGVDRALLPSEVLALARRAVLASKEAASLAEGHFLSTPANNICYSGSASHVPPATIIVDLFWVETSAIAIIFMQFAISLTSQGLNDRDTVLSKAGDGASRRLLERRSRRRRRSPSSNTATVSTPLAISAEISRKMSRGADTNDALRFFLWAPETRQLLTVKEEKELFKKIQELMRLEEVKQNLHSQFGREPTLVEWAEAVGMTCHTLQSCLYSGNRCRERMIYANFRLVVHVAKQYQGKGLNIQDLLQEGSMGLMRSLEKFKPKAGCRFPTYAYWWIRQSIRKAIFQNSRTIRLPENVYALLKKIKHTRRLYLQEGYVPTNEELARRVGITKERLERVVASARSPVSIQDHAWADQDITVQEITADPEVEAPELIVAKQMMRRHVRGLLRVLPARERQIIQFRFGMHGGEPMSLSEIGEMLDLSKERIRQLESRAIDKLKENLPNQGLRAYVELLA